MKTEINIEDYLSASEIKEICVDYVKEILRSGGAPQNERVLGNIAYHCAFAILDEALAETEKQIIREKIRGLLSNPGSYCIFRKKDAWGAEDSPAYAEVKRAVEEHKHLISPLVKQAIVGRDYEADLTPLMEDLGSTLMQILFDGLKNLPGLKGTK